MEFLLRSAVIGFMFFGPFTISAETALLPAWSFSVTGNGSGNITSNGVSGLDFFVSGPPSGVGTYEVAKATSGADVLTVSSSTTYILSASAKLSGPGYSYMYLLVNGSAAATVNIPTTGSGTGMLPYSTSFTTTGPSDALVGQPLTARVEVGAGAGGGGTATFTNITLTVLEQRPALAVRRLNASQIQLAWNTNYSGFLLENASSATNSIWSTNANPVSTQDGEFVVTVDSSPSSEKYFRLHKP
jgi:hypothetical protein